MGNCYPDCGITLLKRIKSIGSYFSRMFLLCIHLKINHSFIYIYMWNCNKLFGQEKDTSVLLFLMKSDHI